MIKKYDSYKDSGLEWIGHIPSSWELIRGKFVFQNKKEINKENQELNLLSLTLHGVLNKDINSNDGLRPTEYSTYQIFEKDDLVFKLIDLENTQTSRVGLVHERGIMSPVYIRLEPQKRISSKYSYYFYYDLYKQHIYNFLGSGVRSSLTPSNLLEIELPLPPLHEQQQIVSFLDTKTTLIDSLIEKTQRKIELLKEKRTSLINELVTKGLNPNVEMKDSDVEWIGEIPSHWGFVKLKQLFFINKRISGELGYDVLSVTQKGLKVKDLENNEGQHSMDYSKYQFVHENDFVMNHMDLLTGYVDLSEQLGVTSPDYRVFTKSNERVNNQFYLYIFQLCYIRKIFYGLGRGVSNLGRWRLPSIEFLNMYLPFPDLREQQQIVEYLDEQTQKIDNTISIEEKRIKLLKEYRQSLISEVVTGKLKVVE